jgi:hypothetical protein
MHQAVVVGVPFTRMLLPQPQRALESLPKHR